MNLSAKLAGSVILGMTAGAAATQAINAQARPPAFAVVEIDVSNPDGFRKEYSPNAGKIMDAAGGKYLTRGPSRKVSIDGEPVKPTTVIIQFDNLEKAQAVFGSSEYREHRKIGDKYAKFRIWLAEGATQ
ncbi:MAG TPA: DUF1330 domain-containing protein [Xanthobacteraceae bacterium]|nr:DUF1330 domain-containing protein [Xanthobacteraceae bacterium]